MISALNAYLLLFIVRHELLRSGPCQSTQGKSTEARDRENPLKAYSSSDSVHLLLGCKRLPDVCEACFGTVRPVTCVTAAGEIASLQATLSLVGGWRATFPENTGYVSGANEAVTVSYIYGPNPTGYQTTGECDDGGTIIRLWH